MNDYDRQIRELRAINAQITRHRDELAAEVDRYQARWHEAEKAYSDSQAHEVLAADTLAVAPRDMRSAERGRDDCEARLAKVVAERDRAVAALERIQDVVYRARHGDDLAAEPHEMQSGEKAS